MTGDFFGPSAWQPMADALVAYAEGDLEAVLTVHLDGGESEAMPVSLFFRSVDEMREVDRLALSAARGRTLDLGAGVGSIALALQDRGVSVTAVEVIPEAVDIMIQRGIKEVREGKFQELVPDRLYETVLLLMNGPALAGTLAGLSPLLRILDGLVAPGGQVLLDSTDLIGDDHPPRTQGWEEGEYPGEYQYQLEFRGRRGAPFPQLFVDPITLREVAAEEGWATDIVWKHPSGEYLARMSRKGEASRP